MKHIVATLLLVTAGLTLAAADAVAGQFKKPAYYPLGEVPYRLITADFNDDGNLDLAVSSFDRSEVAILLGKGNGTFRAAHYFSVSGAASLAAGDFNEDHRLDLAVVEYGGTGNSALGIFLGDGKGNFHNSATYELGIESYSVAVADFDSDGHLDIAVTNRLGYGKGGQSGSVLVFFGNGDGTFKAPVTYKLAGQPCAVAAGDLNGDKHPDLAVAECTGGAVAILMNNGHGKFKQAQTYGAGDVPNDVVIRDLGNGNADLVLSDPSGASIAVLLGNGDGTFGNATLYSVQQFGAANPNAVGVADFNRDGNLDIAVAITGGVADIALLYGNGDGTFQDPVVVAQPSGEVNGLAIGDFNKDGAPDLAVPEDSPNHVAILINKQ
jgi:hypothetical protein